MLRILQQSKGYHGKNSWISKTQKGGCCDSSILFLSGTYFFISYFVFCISPPSPTPLLLSLTPPLTSQISDANIFDSHVVEKHAKGSIVGEKQSSHGILKIKHHKMHSNLETIPELFKKIYIELREKPYISFWIPEILITSGGVGQKPLGYLGAVHE